MIGKAENLHSTTTKHMAQRSPNTIRQMTVVLDQANRVPPSEMGISSKMIMAELNMQPV